MAKTLNNSKRKANEAIDRLTRKDSTKPTSEKITPTGSGHSAITIGSDDRVSVTIPGMLNLTEPALPALLPPFDPNAYQITDPLNPPDSIPQATVDQHERGKGIYEGGIRALQLTGLSQDLTREKFVAIGKQAKALTAGFSALQEQEKTKSTFLDYQTALETTQQKGINYQIASYTTAQEMAALPYVKIQLDEALAQQQLKAQLAQAKTSEALGKLSEFQRSIGQYLQSNQSA